MEAPLAHTAVQHDQQEILPLIWHNLLLDITSHHRKKLA